MGAKAFPARPVARHLMPRLSFRMMRSRWLVPMDLPLDRILPSWKESLWMIKRPNAREAGPKALD